MYVRVQTKTIDSQKEDAGIYCPFTKGKCRSDCMWAVRTDYLSEEGVTVEYECVTTSILHELFEINGKYGEGEE